MIAVTEVPEGIDLTIPEGLYYVDEAGGIHVPLQGGVAEWLAGELLKYQMNQPPIGQA